MSHQASLLNLTRLRRPSVNLTVLILGCLIFAFQLSTTANAQGKLGQIGSSVRKPQSRPSQAAHREPAKTQRKSQPAAKKSRDNDHDHDDHKPSPKLGGKLAQIALAAAPTRVAKPSRENQNQNHGHDHQHHNTNRRGHNQNRNRGRRNRGHQPSFRAPTFIVADPYVPFTPGCGLPPVTAVEPVFVPQPIFVQEPLVIQEPQIATEQVVVQDPIVIQESIVVSDNEVVLPIGTDWFQDSNSKLWATLGSDFDDISSGNLGVLFQAKRGIGLQLSLGTLRESGANFRDHLWLGDANLVYQFVNRPNFKASVGGGLNWLSTNSGNGNWNGDAGVNLKFTADLKLTDRLTASADSNWGTIGQADFTRTRISLNRRFDSVDVLIGAEHLSIGGTEINSAFTGFQLRF